MVCPDDMLPLPAPVWTAHCDGSAVPNPGRMAFGAVLRAPDGGRSTLSRATTLVGCNNEAELRAFIAVLEALRQHGARRVLVHSDNSILVAQLGAEGGVAPAPIARLAPLFDAARAGMRGFDSVRLVWVPRHRNGEADALARAAQGLAPKAVRPPGQSSAKKRMKRESPRL